MSSQLAAIEDSLLALVRGALPNVLRDTGTVPGQWTLDMLRRSLQFAPSVYVGFFGGPLTADQWTPAELHARCGVYVVTKEPTEPARRRGVSGGPIGAYEMVERIVPLLHGASIGGATCTVKSIATPFEDALFELGGTVYEIQCELPLALAPQTIAGLDDFLTFRADYDLEPFAGPAEHARWLEEPPDHTDGAPDLTDTVSL